MGGRWFKLDLEKAKELYARGWSTVEIGAELGVHHGTVSRQLVADGIKLRDSATAQKLKLFRTGKFDPDAAERTKKRRERLQRAKSRDPTACR